MDARSLLIRARRTAQLSRRRPKPLSVEVKRVFKSLVLTLVILLLGASFLFFFNTHSLAQKGFQLRQMELQHGKLRSENEELKQRVLEAQSFKNLSEAESIEDMRPNDAFLYVPTREERISRK